MMFGTQHDRRAVRFWKEKSYGFFAYLGLQIQFYIDWKIHVFVILYSCYFIRILSKYESRWTDCSGIIPIITWNRLCNRKPFGMFGCCCLQHWQKEIYLILRWYWIYLFWSCGAELWIARRNTSWYGDSYNSCSENGSIQD